MQHRSRGAGVVVNEDRVLRLLRANLATKDLTT
jgi:hypothetical protein